MRSYRQYCGLAKALDVIGDRWNLLIVRELLARSPARYTDLHNGLPGIATNLLADRLRELEAAGVVRKYEAPPPVATTVFELTARGEDLWPAIRELGRWGRPLLAGRLTRMNSGCTGSLCPPGCTSPTTSPASPRSRWCCGPAVRP